MNTPNQDRIQELRTMPYEAYLKTSEWKAKRDQSLERDGYRCRACNSSEKLHVHHRTYARRGNEDINDLTTLCQSCHEHFHKKISQTEIMVQTYDAPVVILSNEEQALRLEDQLIGLIMRYPDVCPHLAGILQECDFIDTNTQELFCVFSNTYSSDASFTLQNLEQFVPSGLMPTALRAMKSMKLEHLIDEAKQVKYARKIAMRMKRLMLSRSNEKLQVLIEEAAISGDIAAEGQLRRNIQENRKLMLILHM